VNFELRDFNGKAVIFIGRGREGVSFEKFIKAQAAISSFLFIDQQDDPAYLNSLLSIDVTKTIIVKTAGCPGRTVPVPYTTPTRVFFECIRQLGATVVGVTGTKGKTTTTSLIGAMLKASGKDTRICGNIGVPMLDALEGATQDTIFAVELSSYQLAELETSPHIGVITNLYNDHVDYHGTQELYWEAKRNIMRFMGAQDTLVYNPDFEAIEKWLAESPCKTIKVSDPRALDMSRSKLLGQHNSLNAQMAVAAVTVLGIDEELCKKVVAEFEPVPHRLQIVAEKSGITFIDDAIGSNPEATIAGITTIIKEKGPIGCLMLGGQDRAYEYWPLMQLIARLDIPYLVLFPDAGEKIKRLKPASYPAELFETSNMQAAVTWAYSKCPSGSICLLSTAAPSYSIWKDFEEKGNLFQQAVQALPNEEVPEDI
jgi:UDP-N-acetylmuramoylalanine--D-glutamate ligase